MRRAAPTHNGCLSNSTSCAMRAFTRRRPASSNVSRSRSDFSGSLAVYDALSGEFLRRVAPGNMTTLGLQVPWETIEATR